VQRELKRLHEAGLLVREERGNHVYYSANTNAPVYEELRSLVAKTSGVGGILAEALEPLSRELTWVGIFGSIARGDANASSDVDVVVVGTADEIALHRALLQAEADLRRPINYSVLTPEEFRERRDEPGFIRRVLADDVIDVVGTRDV
jgi:predicted nucleotidyltransferase